MNVQTPSTLNRYGCFTAIVGVAVILTAIFAFLAFLKYLP